MQITIDTNTKISQLLQYDRDRVIDTLIGLNSKFTKLRNPVLRNLLVKRISIADACKITNTPVVDFLHRMEQIGFQVKQTESTSCQCGEFAEPDSYFTLDVRPILAQGKDPLKEILTTVKHLEDNQGLELINAFEPLPLINLLAEKGFTHRIEHKSPDLVITYFNCAGLPDDEPVTSRADLHTVDTERFDQILSGFSPTQISYLNVRHLEMPGPMVAILKQTPLLQKDHALFVYHKKVPVYLLPELDKQNLAYVFKTIAPGDIHLLIYWK